MVTMPRKRNWDSLSPTYQNRLKRNGITKTSYNKGADLSKARGHAKAPTKSAAVSDKLSSKGKNLRILKGNKFRDLTIPVHYKNGVIDKDRLWSDWQSVIAGLKLNPKVFASNTYLYYEHNDQIQAYPLTRAEVSPKLDELISGYSHIVDTYLVKLLGDLKVINLTVHVIFKAKYLKGK